MTLYDDILEDMKQELKENRIERKMLITCMTSDNISLMAYTYCCGRYKVLLHLYREKKHIYELARR